MAETLTPHSGTWNGIIAVTSGDTYAVTLALQASDYTLSGEYSITGDPPPLWQGAGSGEVTGSYSDGVQITLSGQFQASFSATLQALVGTASQVLYGPVTLTVEGSTGFLGVCTLYHDFTTVHALSNNWDT